MNILVTGGTGFIGSAVVRALVNEGHLVTVLTRSTDKANRAPEGVRFTEGDPTRPGPWLDEVTKHQGIINLAGASIFRKWSQAAKNQILQSRFLTTQNIVHALVKNNTTQTYLLNASAVGYYGFCGDDILDEESPVGDDFLAKVCYQWEQTALEAKPLGTRVVLCRIGIVFERGGGAWAKLQKIFNRHLGAQLGSGKQWFSWVHLEDLARIFCYLLEDKELSGPVNCASPNPVRNEDLTKILAQSLGKPLLFPRVPGFMLKLVLGEFAQTLLQGQRVKPQKLLKSGFEFKHPFLQGALDNLLNK